MAFQPMLSLRDPRFEWHVQGIPPMRMSNAGKSLVCNERMSALQQSRVRVARLPFVGVVGFNLDARDYLEISIKRESGCHRSATCENFEDAKRRLKAAALANRESASRRGDFDALEGSDDLDRLNTDPTATASTDSRSL
jgi:hypothetical protein